MKNLYILLESIVFASLANGWSGYRDDMELKMPAILSILFHPKRHLDYHIDYLVKVISCFRGSIFHPHLPLHFHLPICSRYYLMMDFRYIFVPFYSFSFAGFWPNEGFSLQAHPWKWLNGLTHIAPSNFSIFPVAAHHQRTMTSLPETSLSFRSDLRKSGNCKSGYGIFRCGGFLP